MNQEEADYVIIPKDWLSVFKDKESVENSRSKQDPWEIDE